MSAMKTRGNETCCAPAVGSRCRDAPGLRPRVAACVHVSSGEGERLPAPAQLAATTLSFWVASGPWPALLACSYR
ncbi:hypothetical protein TSOC_006289 [Tetrabaena socialis]|uniref:Uncharacterized protein n=1 Tax=Tetrabaena socialis TaxID=47790 RepID=A0A2J8A453_9CHLO|nr:hypothetical protein TSOC_006289 [Tetrabaena socialis]|eukprot:PNH07283.1 hypothetical protein TSOC_006289 [Tetrabaena socialis]